MTLAVVTASLTPAAERALEEAFGWTLSTLPRGSVLGSVDGNVDHERVSALVIETETLDARTLEVFPALSLVACLRGNPVNVDVDAATARGIPVVHTPGRNAESVADLVLGLMYSCVRYIARSHHLVVSRVLTEEREEVRGRKDVVWRPSDPSGPVPYLLFKGPELSRLTLGLLGFGAIGRRVASKACGIGMRVLAHDPFVADAEITDAGAEPVLFERLLRESDVLSLHAPSQPERPLVGARELELMKPTAYVINTARATVLDYDALVDALREGRLAGAGLDVYPDEPLSSASPLLELPNVTLTPHIGGASTNVVDHQSELLLQSLHALAAGNRDSATLRNPEALDRVPDGIPAALRHAGTRAEA